MSQPQQPESFLAADIGSTLTRVCLIDRVEGIYRLVARSQHPTRGEDGIDAKQAVVGAVRRLEEIAHRTLLDDAGEMISPERDDGTGVDAMVACSSAAKPLRCAVIGLTADLSLQGAVRACTGALAQATTTLALGALRRAAELAPLLGLADSPPEAIILSGGFDNGPIAPLTAGAELLAAVLADLPAHERPVIIYAGNQEARRPVARALGDDLTLAVVDNVRPSEGIESPRELQRELLRLYGERLQLVPGMAALQRWCSVPVQSSPDALALALQYLAKRHDPSTSLLGVDVGGNHTAVIGVGKRGVNLTLRGGLGTAAGLDGVLASASLDDLRRWLPLDVSLDTLTAYLENARLWPFTLPQTLDDLLALQAAAREALRQTFAEWQAASLAEPLRLDLIAGRGGVLSGCPHPGLVALMLLDGLQPVGLAQLVYDRDSVWPQLGAVAAVAPLAASQVLNRDGLAHLGTALCLSGSVRTGERALRLRLETPGGPDHTYEVAAGEVRCVPLPSDAEASVKLWPHPRLDVGLGPGAPAQAQVQGGALGLIIDARGRPLQVPVDPQERAAAQRRWNNGLGRR